MKKRLPIIAILLFVISLAAHSKGNNHSDSFSKSKKLLLNKVYTEHKQTLYCGASFNDKKYITQDNGFDSNKFKKRAKKVEWEHAVPAENFGKTFAEWRSGHAQCVKNDGKAFKGRKCAEKINTEYRYMQADMYNLFPAIGAANALRSNYNFVAALPSSENLGACAMKIGKRKVEPPTEARGRIARSYLYMQAVYPRYKMSSQQMKLMSSWNNMYPVSRWECQRYKRIKQIQGNENPVMAGACR